VRKEAGNKNTTPKTWYCTCYWI